MDEGRIKSKINEIEKFLEELESSLPCDFETYKHNFQIKAICERYFEKIIEAVVDLAFLIIKEKSLDMPEDDESSFIVFVNENIISLELCNKLRAAKGMRNIIAHEYGKIDDARVFHAVTEELIPDVKEFLESVERLR